MNDRDRLNDPPRRETHVEHEAVYAAAGASAAPDLQRFPPEGSTPFETELKLGSGPERFIVASSMLMTWGAHRASGIEVRDIHSGGEDQYRGVVFDADGTPEPASDAEVRYSPDGEPFVTAGTTASLTWPGGKMTRRMRVVYVLDDARRVGFALGSADDAGVIGETVYQVEHREDDGVWAVARGFYWASSNGLFGRKGRAAIRLAVRDAAKQLAALAPGAADRGSDPSDGPAESPQSR